MKTVDDIIKEGDKWLKHTGNDYYLISVEDWETLKSIVTSSTSLQIAPCLRCNNFDCRSLVNCDKLNNYDGFIKSKHI